MDESKSRLSDIATLRRNAREHLENGAVTTDYRADRKQVLRLLNEALATEIVCWLRYRRHYFMAKGIHAEVAAAEFLEHSNQEAEHADLVAERIAIASYGEFIRHLGSDDPTTRTLLERILATEEEHADDLVALLDGIRS